MKYILIASIALFSISLSGQNSSVKGKIRTESNDKIDLCTLMLLSQNDSTIVCGDTFFSEDFEFNGLNPQVYILRVQDVQYQISDTIIRLNEGLNILSEPIILKGRSLDEVVVNAKRPVMHRKNGNLVLDVRNSYLKDEGRIGNLLEKIPGIEVDATGSFSMFGKDNLLIYINNIQVVSQDQLKSLQPSDIDRIEIIKNAGATYNASVDAVVKIWTKRNMEENFRVTINTNTTYGRKWSNDMNIGVCLNTGRISQFFTYYNDISNGRQFDDNATYTQLKDYLSVSKREIMIDNEFRNHNLFYSLEYDLNDKNRLGFQYSGMINKWNSDHSGLQTIKSDETENERRKIRNADVNKKNLHNMSVNFQHKFDDKKQLTLISDYATSRINTGNDVNEYNMNTDYSAHQYNSSLSDYNIFSVHPEFRFSINSNELTFGTKYSTMSSDSEIRYSSTDSKTNHRLNEHIGALYATWNGKLGSYTYSAGLRGEYAQSKIEVDDSQHTVNRHNWDLFPYIMLGKSITKNVNVSLHYRKRIQRPSFSALNPTFLYRDSLSYTTGNPYLKPMKADMFALSVEVSKISFSVGYYIYKNSIVFEDVQDANNPSIAISTYGNMRKNNKLLNASINYSYTFRKLSGIAAFDVNKPFVEVPYLDAYRKMNRPICLFKLSENLQLSENTSISSSFTVRSKGDSKNVAWETYSRLNLGISQYAFDKKLLMSLSVDDVFNKNKTNRWTSYSNNIHYTMDSDSDSRCVMLNLKYTIGVSKKNIQKKSSNTESINRM